MADHIVKLSRVPSLQVGKADVRFDVKDENGKVGTLLVSKGGIEWRPSKKQNRPIPWPDFDRLMRGYWGDEKKKTAQA